MQEFLNLPKQIQLRQLVRFVTITLGSSIFPFILCIIRLTLVRFGQVS